jgi:hypothetical protein
MAAFRSDVCTDIVVFVLHRGMLARPAQGSAPAPSVDASGRLREDRNTGRGGPGRSPNATPAGEAGTSNRGGVGSKSARDSGGESESGSG